MPEYLSLFIDRVLKSRSNNLEQQTFEIILDKTIVVLDYIISKDTFEKYYQLHLSKRLLSKNDVFEKYENDVITRLKTKFYSEFIRKLKIMLNDILVSNENMKNFESYISNENINDTNIGLNIYVLTSGSWPIETVNHQCNLSRPVDKVYRYFCDYYKNIYTGRRLTLHCGIGLVHLTSTFYGDGEPKIDHNHSNRLHTSKETIIKRKYILQVSTYHMIILLLFNMKDSWSYEVG